MSHIRELIISALVVFSIFTSYTQVVLAEDVKTISGMSIVGNNEAPKSLYIVPWKSSEIGMETDLSSNLLNESLMPVDKDVFMREVNFYMISTGTQ